MSGISSSGGFLPKMNKPAVLFLGCGFLFVAGCRTRVEQQQLGQTLSEPDSWASAVEPGDYQIEGGWISEFGDPELKRWIGIASTHNFSLRSAAARLDAAEELARMQGGDLWPELNASGSGNRRRSASGIESSTYSAGLALSWEIDLWGRVRDTAGAAFADYQASEADYEFARLSLAASIARAWFNLVESGAQLRLAEKTLESFESNAITVADRYRRGLVTALDVRLARANAASARSTVAQRLREKDARVKLLETLLGRYPEGGFVIGGELPDIADAVPAGLPSELLSRRPDLVSAERQLASANLESDIAFKSRLPSIALTASGGRESDAVDRLLKGDANVWSLFGNLTLPIFQGGRLRANQRRTESLAEAALYNYANVVLQAFREVETALSADHYWDDQVEALRDSTKELDGAENLAWENYQRGLTDIITLLETQRRAFTARSALLNARNQRLQNRIDLHLALGGDFEKSNGMGL